MYSGLFCFAFGDGYIIICLWIHMIGLPISFKVIPLAQDCPSIREVTLRLCSLSGRTSKSQSREIGCYNDCIALKFGKHLGSAATEAPVNFKAIEEVKSRISRLSDFARCGGKKSKHLVNRGPEEYGESELRQIDSKYCDTEPGGLERIYKQRR